MAKKKPEKDVSQMTAEEILQKNGGKRYRNSVMTDAGSSFEPGDIANYVNIGMRIMSLPKVDLKDPEAVQNRIAEYFQIYADGNTKPTVQGLANALGIDRRRLWEIKTGANDHTSNDIINLPRESADSVKKAYKFLDEMYENYMANGKINPVSGIFLGKNNHGYADRTEYVVTPNVTKEDDFNEDDIRKRYLRPGADPDSE